MIIVPHSILSYLPVAALKRLCEFRRMSNMSAGVQRIVEVKRQSPPVTISGLGYYPNPLHPDQAHRDEVIGHLKTVIDAAQLLGVEIVGSIGAAEDLDGALENGPEGEELLG